MNVMTSVPNQKNSWIGKVAGKDLRPVWKLLAGVYFWLSFVRLPATSVRDSFPQSWASVLSFASAHHLQWGRDVIFTYGPLGFLTSDYYWGNFFWPILFWGFGFALVISAVLVHFWGQLPALPRIAIFVAAPLLTTPGCLELGADPIYFLSIMLVGIACLPHERPGLARFFAAGVFFAVISSIKFTFSLYCLFSVLVIVAAHLRAGTWRGAITLPVSTLAAFLATRAWAGQSLGNILLDFRRSAHVASAYS